MVKVRREIKASGFTAFRRDEKSRERKKMGNEEMYNVKWFF
jgi:hypothetical protein